MLRCARDWRRSTRCCSSPRPLGARTEKTILELRSHRTEIRRLERFRYAGVFDATDRSGAIRSRDAQRIEGISARAMPRDTARHLTCRGMTRSLAASLRIRHSAGSTIRCCRRSSIGRIPDLAGTDLSRAGARSCVHPRRYVVQRGVCELRRTARRARMAAAQGDEGAMKRMTGALGRSDRFVLTCSRGGRTAATLRPPVQRVRPTPVEGRNDGARLNVVMQAHRDQLGRQLQDWFFREPVNNARLVPLAAYNELVAGFEGLFAESRTNPGRRSSRARRR